MNNNRSKGAVASTAVWVSLLLLLLVWLRLGVAGASPLTPEVSAAMKEIAGGQFAASLRGVQTLGSLRDPQAVEALEALAGAELVVDSKTAEFFVHSKQGLLHWPSRQPAVDVDPPKALNFNNRLRRAVAVALSRAHLRSEQVQLRRQAAVELSQSPAVELLGELREALRVETDEQVTEALELGIARLDLSSDQPVRQLRALEEVDRLGAVEFLNTVRSLVGSGSPEVAQRARALLSRLERKVLVFSAVANLFYGLSLGSVLLLAALGLAITFGLMRVINMAHGEMLMLGAYATYVVQRGVQAWAPSLFEYYLLFAVPTAFAVCALVGVLMERTVIRFLYGRPLETLLATWGLSLILIQTIRLSFGAQNVAVENPQWLSGGWQLVPNVVLPFSRLAVVGFCLLVVGLVWFLLQRTRLGVYVRAVTQNREMAANVGIPTQRIDVWTFALGSAVAGLGGVALSQLGNVGPELGQTYIVDSFMVVVLGGVGSLVGTVSGGLGLGVANKLLEPAMGAVLGKILLLGVLILFIQWRPQGIFAPKGRAAEL